MAWFTSYRKQRSAHHSTKPERRRMVRSASVESLEARQMLDAAPVALPDDYEIPSSGELVVGMLMGPLAPQQTTAPEWEVPDGLTPNVEHEVTGGESETVEFVVLGTEEGKYDQALVRDPGSTLNVTNWMEVGRPGFGEVLVSNGGLLNVKNWTEIGGGASNFGHVAVSGAGSKWIASNWISAGNNGGRGWIDISEGAQVSGTFLSLASYRNGIAVANISGAGTQVNMSDWIGLGGYGGHAFVTVSEGAVVTHLNFLQVGHYEQGTASLRLTGPGTQWNVGNHASVGEYTAQGTLDIEDGAVMNVQNWMEVGRSESTGIVTIRGEGSRLSVREFFGIGGGGNGAVRLIDGGWLKASSVSLYSTGVLTGQGTVETSRIDQYGTIEPGDRVGSLRVTGSIEQNSTSSLGFDIAGSDGPRTTLRGVDYDGLDVGGSIRADGKVVVRFSNGFAPVAGDRFELIKAASHTGDFDSVKVEGLRDGFEYDAVWENGTFVLIAKNNGEAATNNEPGKGVLANDTDPDGDRLSVILTDGPDHGRLVLYANGSFSYTPNNTFPGEDLFSYIATDGFGNSQVAKVTLRNDPPVGQADSYGTDEDQVLEVSAADGVLKNDSDPNGGALKAVRASGPAQGELRLNEDGSFRYAPRPNFNGEDSFTYRAFDGVAFSEPVTVKINVASVNDAPIAKPDQKTIQKNTTLNIRVGDLLANDSDPDGDKLELVAVQATDNTHGTVSLAAGVVTYKPDNNFVGTATFRYVIRDGQGGEATGTVTVQVRNVVQTQPGKANGTGVLDNFTKFFYFNVESNLSLSTRPPDVQRPRGTLFFADLQKQLFFQATSVQSLKISSTGRTAEITGIGRMYDIGGLQFTVKIGDNGFIGDTFSIVITGPNGFRYDSLANGNGRVQFGNITIRPSRGIFLPFAARFFSATDAALETTSTWQQKPRTVI